MNFFIWACSVCYGNPSSALVKGASAGALFLMGIVALVLTGIAATILTWSRRAARLERPPSS